MHAELKEFSVPGSQFSVFSFQRGPVEPLSAMLGTPQVFTFKVLTRVYYPPPPPPVFWNHRVRGKSPTRSLILNDLYQSIPE